MTVVTVNVFDIALNCIRLCLELANTSRFVSVVFRMFHMFRTGIGILCAVSLSVGYNRFTVAKPIARVHFCISNRYKFVDVFALKQCSHEFCSNLGIGTKRVAPRVEQGPCCIALRKNLSCAASSETRYLRTHKR